MSHKHYNTFNLTLEEKREILHRAKEKCDKWWVDVLDCKKSWFRQQIEMPFDEIMQKLDGRSHFRIVHRKTDGSENHLEIGFSTLGDDPEYFLWIILDIKYLDEFTT